MLDSKNDCKVFGYHIYTCIRQTDQLADRPTQTDRLIDYRKTDRQAGRQTHTHTPRHITLELAE